MPWNGVPTIYKNVVVLGATAGEVPLGPPGDTRAFDARTGTKLWEFHTVPQPGRGRPRDVARRRLEGPLGRQHVGAGT